ncbi:E3 ubiquitin-protein ligase TRIM15-like [Emys orbicularis]|uniref:E3 ubiquitin-protein ligase TRIM15-like n=1 Tax=Emys orbicularis TaxID=82168 RepID=UPI0031FCBBF0
MLTLESTKEPEVGTVCEKHQRALDVFCQVEQTPICLVCHLSGDNKEHPVVPIEEAAEDYKDQIRSRLEILKKEKEVILSFKLSGENKSHELQKQLETEKQKIVSEFQQLRQFLEEQEQLRLAQLEELNQEIEKRKDEYVAKLSEEISSFSSLINEMEQKCQQPAREFLEDIKGTLSRCEREKFQNPVAFSSELKWRIWESFQINASLETIMKKFKDSLSSRQRLDKANVTLDPDTAHPQLIVSADRKSVRWERKEQDLPNNPERFDSVLCLLGSEGFTSGRHYWEVEVEGRGVYDVGVARESVSRKGDISPNPEQGIWAVQCSEDWYWTPTSPDQGTPLSPSCAPSRIRVYLDCEGGQVTFFHAGNGDPIVTFPSASFAGERIRPFFRAVPPFFQASRTGPRFWPAVTVRLL